MIIFYLISENYLKVGEIAYEIFNCLIYGTKKCMKSLVLMILSEIIWFLMNRKLNPIKIIEFQKCPNTFNCSVIQPKYYLTIAEPFKQRSQNNYDFSNVHLFLNEVLPIVYRSQCCKLHSLPIVIDYRLQTSSTVIF